MYPFVDFCCGCCKDAFIESGAESSDASKWFTAFNMRSASGSLPVVSRRGGLLNWS